MEAYLLDWLNLLVRWLHFIAGIAWIGASFYFVMLDNSLSRPKKPEDATRGVSGELWAVHGGGFYCSQKYLTGPKGEPLSENLHWSKWEAYTKWLYGMGLLALIYWGGASSCLIDKDVLALSPAAAVPISMPLPAGASIVYDTRCRVLGKNEILPVLFTMISSHYPLTYSHPYGWVVLGVIMLAGVLIRQFFVLRHSGKVNWALPGIAVVLLVGVAIAIAPKSAGKGSEAVAFVKVQ